MKRIEQVNGDPVWFSDDFVCAAKDHGSFCRLCQPVDEITWTMLQLVMDGAAVCRAKSDGELEFRLTDQGIRRAEQIIKRIDPEVSQ